MVAKKLDLLAIIGPTASGKTKLAIDIAKKYNGEIIAADSRTIYKHLDIGTAKPDEKEQDGIVHWGLNLVGPGQKFTVSDYKIYADLTIQSIKDRNKLPIIVGGSGLYVDSVLYNFSLAPAKEELRKRLEKLDVEHLQIKLLKKGLKMPINKLNKRHLIRVIERGNFELSREPLNKNYLIIGISPTRVELEDRITERANLMLKSGVLKEIIKVSKLYGWDSEAMTGGIYRVFRDVLNGDKSEDQALVDFIRSDLKLAKKQMTWFKRNSDIHWFKDTSSALTWFDKTFSGKL